MSDKLEVLKQRLEPRIAEVLARYGVLERVPVHAVVGAIVDGLISRKKRTFLTARQQILIESNGCPRCWVCNLFIPMDAPADSYACFSIDHVMERCRGGHWLGRGNLRAAHRICNMVRSNRPKEKGRKKYVAFLRQLAEEQGETCSLLPSIDGVSFMLQPTVTLPIVRSSLR